MPETRKYTVADLFAGVGGLSYGFSRNNRFEIILANEMQKDIAKAYTLNHPAVNMLQGDIKDLSEDILRQAIGIRTVDVVVGGPPCQSYSTLGKRQIGQGEDSLDRPQTHTIFSLPLSFTMYTLTETKLIIQRGCFNLREDEIQLYRVRDIAFKQNFYERLCRVGSIHLCSTDAMTPEIDIRRIKNPRDVKEVLSKTIEACRKANGIRTSEIIGDHGRFPEPDPHGMPPEPCHEHPHD